MDTVSYRIELFHWDQSVGTVDMKITAVSQPSSLEIAQQALEATCLPDSMLLHPTAWSAAVVPLDGPSTGVLSLLPVVTLQA